VNGLRLWRRGDGAALWWVWEQSPIDPSDEPGGVLNTHDVVIFGGVEGGM
jgi:hypothetical protein